MATDKLTQRAKNVILSLPHREKVKFAQILDAIGNSDGMASKLLTIFSDIHTFKGGLIDVNEWVIEAFYEAIKVECAYVGTEHLLLSLLKLSGYQNFNAVRLEVLRMNIFPGSLKGTESAKKTPILDSYGENLNQKVLKQIDRPLLEREEYQSLLSVLLQQNNSSALLVGEKGVGKHSLVEFLAQNVNYLNVPPALVGFQIIEFDLLGFMTNAFNKNSVELVLASFVDELKFAGRVILYIKNFQNIFFATNSGFTVPMFYSMFKSSLDAAGVRSIGAITTSLYEKVTLENEHILEGFTVIDVFEPKEDLIRNIIKINALHLSQYHNVEISPEIQDYVFQKARDDIKDTRFPQKVLDLIDQACSRLVLKNRVVPESYKELVDRTFYTAQTLDRHIESGELDMAEKTRKKLIKMETDLISQESKIFEDKRIKLTTVEVDEALEEMGVNRDEDITEDGLSGLTSLSKRIKKKIIGQDEAIETVVKSLIRARLGLRSKKRPIGNFLFLGPTGVGKTELAKVLADTAFGKEEGSLIRLDMSDFSEKHTVARLVGAPPGYVGYGEGGELTSRIESHPESVVLFDEIEKAHPDVLNILLQIMEEGELKDAKGGTFDFSKAIVILTSNLGTEFMHKNGIGFDEKVIEDSNIEERLKTNLKKIMKPELINRFDEVIVFKRIKESDQLKIVDILINEVNENLTKQQVELKIGLRAKKGLLKKGYSEEYGARALRRTVEKELLDKIAEVLLEHKKRPLVIKASWEKTGLKVLPL